MIFLEVKGYLSDFYPLFLTPNSVAAHHHCSWFDVWLLRWFYYVFSFSFSVLNITQKLSISLAFRLIIIWNLQYFLFRIFISLVFTHIKFWGYLKVLSITPTWLISFQSLLDHNQFPKDSFFPVWLINCSIIIFVL